MTDDELINEIGISLTIFTVLCSVLLLAIAYWEKGKTEAAIEANEAQMCQNCGRNPRYKLKMYCEPCLGGRNGEK